MKKYRYNVKNLDCVNCARKIEEKLSKIDNYKNVSLNYSTLKLTLESNIDNPINDIKKVVKSIEPEVEILNENDNKDVKENYILKIVKILIGTIITIIGVSSIINNEIISESFIILGYIILLYDIAKITIKKLFKNKTIDESMLITISCIGAYLIGNPKEGLMVIILYSIGKILEEKAVGKTRRSIKDLMDIKPEYANLKVEDKFIKVNPEQVKIGDIIEIKKGEKVALDGIVQKGNASLNTSALTGETKLLEVNEGDNILSGSINANGIIEVKVTERYINSTVNKVLELVETATDKKAKTENFVSKAAKIYTPIVMLLALMVIIFMPILFNKSGIHEALVFLVISCPCSIAISVPLSFFCGIGKSAKEGILIKGSDYLDTIRKIKEIVFDKTGTITTGEFEVDKIQSLGNLNDDEVYKYFVMGENHSNHPIAQSIINYRKIKVENVNNLEEVSGKGIKYEYQDNIIKLGNRDFVDYKETEYENGTILYLSINNKIEGKIIIKDKIKGNSKKAISNLKSIGIKTEMFTGDREDVAKEVTEKVGIDGYIAEMLPQDKFNEFEKIIKNNEGNSSYKVAFVGDGINDSPVIARADIGISMGGLGASSSIEASDIVIMTDELDKIYSAIKISKKTNKIIKQNLIFSIGIKILVLVLTMFGLSNMWEAVFADVGVTIISIFNTLRILK